jgi:hypothetical protein
MLGENNLEQTLLRGDFAVYPRDAARRDESQRQSPG